MIAEIQRLLENLLRFGVVTEVDQQRVRVQSGELLTGWLRWGTTRAGAFSTWLPPSVGEVVLLGCPGGNPESAVILCSFAGNAFPAPASEQTQAALVTPDGAQFLYDAQTHTLTVQGVASVQIEASTHITLDAPVVKCTRLLKAASLTLSGGGTLEGDITHTGGLLTSNGVTVSTHTHSGVRAGSDTSGGPL